MLQAVFVLAVVVGFILWWLAAWPRNPPVPPYTEWAARFCFMVAAVLWGIGAFHR